MESMSQPCREQYWEEMSVEAKLDFIADRLDSLAHYIKQHDEDISNQKVHRHIPTGEPAVLLSHLQSKDSMCLPWWFSHVIPRKPR